MQHTSPVVRMRQQMRMPAPRSIPAPTRPPGSIAGTHDVACYNPELLRLVARYQALADARSNEHGIADVFARVMRTATPRERRLIVRLLAVMTRQRNQERPR